MNLTTSRAIVRIARRNIGRSRWRSMLISLLVMLPVAAMVGAATVLQTVTPTAQQMVTHQMGAADLVVYPSGPGATGDVLLSRLPPGSRIEPLRFDEGRVVLPGMEASVTLRSMDLAGVGRGMIALVDGRLPRNPGEVAISSPVASVAGVGIGDAITIKGLGAPTVVGLVEDRFNLKARVVLQDVSAAVAAQAEGRAIWLVGLPPGTDVASLDLVAAFAQTDALFTGQTREQATFESDGLTPAIIVLGGLALVEAALVASAAFAVSIRRRQRELGLLAATGAQPGHLAGTVVAEGALLGGLGVLIGAVVGLVGALAISPWLDQLTDRRIPPLSPSLSLILIAGCIGLVAALVAAFVPAWTAARLPVLMALSGRRPASAPARRTLSLGILMIGVAIALTSAGATMRLSDTSGSSMSILLLLAGAVLGTLGFGACSPWLLERLERPAARLPLASRIALRDTARARSRNGPIVTAVLASFAATVALAAYAASQDAIVAASWQPWLRPDQIFMQGEAVARGGPDAARELKAIAAAPIHGAGSEDKFVWITPGDGTDPNLGIQNVTVGDGELLKALGAESATADLSAGSVVLLTQEPASETSATVHVTDAQGTEVETFKLPARVVVTGIAGGDLPGAVISAETATRVGVTAGTSDRYVIRLDHPVTDGDLARAASIVAQYPDSWADASRGPSRPGEAFRVALLIGSLLLALSVTGVAVALGEAESRPEQRTLLALGADPRLRRRIAAARAGVLAVLAGALAVPAGLLPIWGLLASRHAPLIVPVPEVVAALAVLPLLAVAGTWLLSRPIPAWSAFRNPTT